MKLNQDLVAAAAEGGSDTVDKLINDGADIDWVPSAGSGSGIGTALHRASRNGHEDVVRILLEVRSIFFYKLIDVVTANFSVALALITLLLGVALHCTR